MKKNDKFKMIAAIVSALLIVIGIFVPAKASVPMELIGMTVLFILGILRWIVPSKKYTKLKILGLLFLYLVLISWVLPAAQFYSGQYQETEIARVSLFNLIDYPYLSLQFFLQQTLFVLAVSGLYGVLSETGKYRNSLDKITKQFKGKENYFLIGASLILTLMSSLLAVNTSNAAMFGPNIVLFLLIPFVCGIVLLMGYDKMTAFLVGFISPLIGIIGGIYSQTTSYVNLILGSTNTTELVAKIFLLVVTYIIYIAFVLKYAKKAKEKNKDNKEKDETKEDIPLIGEKKQSKKPSWPIYVILGLLIVLMILGMTNWKETFNVTFFEDLHTKITEWKIADYTIISYLIKGLEGFGSWASLNEITVLILAGTIILALVYNLNFEETIDAFSKGLKKLAKPAIIMTLAYTVVIITAYNPYFVTVTHWMVDLGNNIVNGLENINFLSGIMTAISNIIYLLVAGINTILNTILNIDMLYVVQSGLPLLSNAYPDATNSLAIITQSLHGLTLFIAPTSAMMILGLEYLDIPYKEWLKTSWKLVLQLLAIILVIILIVIFI